MAFIRKHRERYWLVHNFRADGKVRQVRLYAFDLHANPDHEIERAQQAVESFYTGQIAPTWIQPVRQRLQQLQEGVQQQQREQQVHQLHQQMADVVQTLDLLQAPPEEKHRLIRKFIGQLQVRLEKKTDPFPDTPVHDARNTETPKTDLGQGFCLLDQTLYHACTQKHDPADKAETEQPGNQPPALSPVVWVSLINGRDLWLECHTCHARWHNLSTLGQFPNLNMHRQRISKFDRFCREHQVGDPCYILIQYRSGRVDRLHGTIQDIDYATKKVLVASTPERSGHTYWRNVDNVYFGHLEVRLTDEQHAQVARSGKGELTHLVHNWYALPDTPDTRLFLRQLGIRY